MTNANETIKTDETTTDTKENTMTNTINDMNFSINTEDDVYAAELHKDEDGNGVAAKVTANDDEYSAKLRKEDENNYAAKVAAKGEKYAAKFHKDDDNNGYGLKLVTKRGEYGARFLKDDENNWGITLSRPNKADTRLAYEGGKGAVSYSDAEGNKSSISFGSARQWIKRRLTKPAKDEGLATEAAQADAQ